MIAVPVPGVASLIQSTLLNIIQLDILQTGSWLVPYLTEKNTNDQGEAPDDESLNDYFDAAGFGSTRMLLNLGSTLVFIWLYLITIAVYTFFRYIGFLWPK